MCPGFLMMMAVDAARRASDEPKNEVHRDEGQLLVAFSAVSLSLQQGVTK